MSRSYSGLISSKNQYFRGLRSNLDNELTSYSLKGSSTLLDKEVLDLDLNNDN